MTGLSQLFRAILVIALLPWGAYLGANLGAPAMAQAAEAQQHGAWDAVAALPAHPAKAAPRDKRCRTALPHGTGCAQAVAPKALTLPDQVWPDAPLTRPHTRWPAPGRGAAPPREPPRLI